MTPFLDLLNPPHLNLVNNLFERLVENHQFSALDSMSQSRLSSLYSMMSSPLTLTPPNGLGGLQADFTMKQSSKKILNTTDNLSYK